MRRGWHVTEVDLTGRLVRRATRRAGSHDPRLGRGRCGRPAFGRGAGGRCRAPGPPRSAGRPDATTSPTPTRTHAATPGCASCATAMSGSRRCPAAGSMSASCWVGRGGRRSARRRTAVAGCDRGRHPAHRRRPGGLARRLGRRTRWPAPGRSATASPVGPAPGWLLVGDAAGFLDPFTGEGLHRALVSAELAAAAIAAHRRGRRGAFDAYERAMQRRFLAKDAVSWLVQAFLGRPRPVRLRGPAGRRASGGSCDDGSRDG